MRQRGIKWLIVSPQDKNFLFQKVNPSNSINHQKEILIWADLVKEMQK